jgi:hypothetical protein
MVAGWKFRGEFKRGREASLSLECIVALRSREHAEEVARKKLVGADTITVVQELSTAELAVLNISEAKFACDRRVGSRFPRFRLCAFPGCGKTSCRWPDQERRCRACAQAASPVRPFDSVKPRSPILVPPWPKRSASKPAPPGPVSRMITSSGMRGTGSAGYDWLKARSHGPS